jgi:hypothetical protein
MLHPGADMIVVGSKKNLSLVLEAAVGLTVKKAGVITLEV